MKYKVIGEVSVCVTIIVEADNPDAAYDAAENQLQTLEAYVGNGGMDKIIGVSGENESVESSDNIDWFDIEAVDE